jgi:D-galactarolactone cycloisomerase
LKILSVRAVPLRTAREVGALEPAWKPGGRKVFRVGGGNFVQIQADNSLVGIGPRIDPNLIPAFRRRLIGKDPLEIVQDAASFRVPPPGPLRRGNASVDIALWDLIGKACGKPLYKLWGGEREKVTVYASTVKLSTAGETPLLASELLKQGWKAIKLRLHHEAMEEDVRSVEAVRRAVGDRMEIMTDANQAQSSGVWQPGVRWDFQRALETARVLHRLNCSWLEEPLPRYAFDQLSELTRRVDIPLAGGEHNSGFLEFGSMLERGVYDILQPDVRVCGGITELRKIATLAQSFGKRVEPHHGGGPITSIALLHLVASWPHASWLELLHDPPIGAYQHRFSVFRSPPVLDKNGCMSVPEGPGLGVEIDPDLVSE